MSAGAGLVEEAAELFGRFRGGEPGAIEPLVRLLNPTLWHLARGCGLDRGDAEDVVQTAWLRLVDKAADIRDPRTVLAWLGTTVRREAWRVRGDGRRALPWGGPEEDDGGVPEPRDPGPGPAEELLRDEAQRALWSHVSRLSARCQALLRVVSRGGPPDYSALSESLGIPVGSIGPTRGRCLAALRKSLAADPAWSTP